MKTILSLLALASTSAAVFASAGPGPWANATYYPGNLDGKYQAAVYGNNISGVLGFALQNGSPTIATNTTLTTSNNSTQATVVVDPFQNYFAIFVEGRTYTGLSTATVDYNNSSVTGTLIGAQPDFAFLTGSNSVISSQTFTNTNIVTNQITVDNNGVITFTNTFTTNISVTNVFTTNSLPAPLLNPAGLVNRGLNGGFRADVNGDGGVFTFTGNGELSTPAQFQTVNFTTNAKGEIIGAQVATDTVPFQLNGIRVSFTTTP